MTDELTTADDLSEGQIVIDTQEDIEIEVIQTGGVFVLENEHGRSEATREEIDQLIELGAIRARSKTEIVDSILDNMGPELSDEEAWECAAGSSSKEDEVRNYPMGSN